MQEVKKKPLIIKLAVERKIEAGEEKLVYDPVTSMNRINGGRIDYENVMELMTKTEQGREEDRSDSDFAIMECMTKTFSSTEADD